MVGLELILKRQQKKLNSEVIEKNYLVINCGRDINEIICCGSFYCGKREKD